MFVISRSAFVYLLDLDVTQSSSFLALSCQHRKPMGSVIQHALVRLSKSPVQLPALYTNLHVVHLLDIHRDLSVLVESIYFGGIP